MKLRFARSLAVLAFAVGCTTSALADGPIVVMGERIPPDDPVCYVFGDCAPLADSYPIDPTISVTGLPPGGFGTLINTSMAFCKRGSETCAQWGQRMVLQVCPRFGIGAQGGCNAAVGVEVNVNGCSNPKPCVN